MSKIEIEVPDRIADSSLMESIKDFLHKKFVSIKYVKLVLYVR
jgi:hypothetical protein